MLLGALAAGGLMLAAQAAPAGAHPHLQPRAHHASLHGHHSVVRPHHTAPCANANTPATSASVATMDAAAECLINQQRVKHGLLGLTVSSRLTSAAQGWNNAMVARGDFTHGIDFSGRISAVGYNWQAAGENIATGYLTPAQAVAGWMASTDHCHNILDPVFRNIGTGETPALVGGWASGPATWTQDFGLLMSQSQLSGNTGPQSGCPYG